ncbi:low affinity immunoglobulin gamma Fc region receptor II-a [Pterocles gutturalis]
MRKQLLPLSPKRLRKGQVAPPARQRARAPAVATVAMMAGVAAVAMVAQMAAMAVVAVLLLWDPQPSQLTPDPPWTPVFRPETVTLTCGDPGAPGPTDWFMDGELRWQRGPPRVEVTKELAGTHQCHRAGAALSPPVTVSFSNDWLALQVPARALLEGDPLRLRCRGWRDARVSHVQFFREREPLGGPSGGAELLLPPLQLHHAGRYRCQATVGHVLAVGRQSATATVVVGELFSVPELRLGGPAEPPEGTPLSLGCHSRPSPLRPLARLQHLFYREGTVVGGPQSSPQLWLPPVGLPHSGNYSCEVRTQTGSVRKRSPPVSVTVRRVPVSGVSLVADPPRGQVLDGDRLVLSCAVAAGTGPVAFSWHRDGSAAPLATGPRYQLSAVRLRDSGSYHCAATNGGTAATSPPVRVTVLVPVAGAAISTARTEPRVPAGARLNLSCLVREGTAPVTFTWLRDGQELGWGPVLALDPVVPAHAGTYQCQATNRPGGHRVFRARSPTLALAVTLPGWGRWQQGTASGQSGGRDPPAPPQLEGLHPAPTGPPGEEEVTYAHVVVTEPWGGPPLSRSRPPGGSPRPGPPREPPVTYAELPGPHARPRPPSDTYENVP